MQTGLAATAGLAMRQDAIGVFQSTNFSLLNLFATKHLGILGCASPLRFLTMGYITSLIGVLTFVKCSRGGRGVHHPWKQLRCFQDAAQRASQSIILLVWWVMMNTSLINGCGWSIMGNHMEWVVNKRDQQPLTGLINRSMVEYPG